MGILNHLFKIKNFLKLVFLSCVPQSTLVSVSLVVVLSIRTPAGLSQPLVKCARAALSTGPPQHRLVREQRVVSEGIQCRNAAGVAKKQSLSVSCQ